MASIEITRAHSRPIPEARKLVQRVADHIAERFDVTCAWDGNTLNFQRSGVDGHIKVTAKQIHVTANLSFLLLAIRGTVEREIHRYLEEEFG
jgi:putative polyhydroxyalkanoate system protein